MRDRLLNNWTFIRFFYLSIGLYIAISSTLHMEWMGIMLGSYFASMGLFAFGCASGQCSGRSFNSQHVNRTKDADLVEYEEIR